MLISSWKSLQQSGPQCTHTGKRSQANKAADIHKPGSGISSVVQFFKTSEQYENECLLFKMLKHNLRFVKAEPEHPPSLHRLLINVQTVGAGCLCFVLFGVPLEMRRRPSYDVAMDAPSCANTPISLNVSFL